MKLRSISATFYWWSVFFFERQSFRLFWDETILTPQEVHIYTSIADVNKTLICHFLIRLIIVLTRDKITITLFLPKINHCFAITRTMNILMSLHWQKTELIYAVCLKELAAQLVWLDWNISSFNFYHRICLTLAHFQS